MNLLRKSSLIIKLIGLAALARLLFFAVAIWVTGDIQTFHSVDTQSYLEPARALANTGRFSIEGVPFVYRSPGYSIFLIPGIWVGQVEIITVLIQTLLSLVSIYLIYQIGLALFSCRQSALFGAALFAFEPLGLLYNSAMVAETPFLTAFILGCYLLVRFLQTEQGVYLYASALCIGIATYIKPVSYYLPIFLAMGMVLYGLASKGRHLKYFLHILIFLVLYAAVIGPWHIRNHHFTGYRGFSGSTEFNLYYVHRSAILAKKENSGYIEYNRKTGYYLEMDKIHHPARFPDTKGCRFNALGQKGKTVILQNLDVFLPIYFDGIIRILIDPGATNYLRVLQIHQDIHTLIGEAVDMGLFNAIFYFLKERPLVFWSNLFFGIFLLAYYFLGLVGVFTQYKHANILKILPVCIGLYFLFIAGGAYSVSRFRMPIMPFICLFSGSGFSYLISRFKAKQP